MVLVVGEVGNCSGCVEGELRADAGTGKRNVDSSSATAMC